MSGVLDFACSVGRLARADLTKLGRYWVVLAGFAAMLAFAVPGTVVFHWVEQAANVTSSSGWDFALSVMNRMLDVSTPILYVLICILFAIDVSNSTVKYLLTRPITRMELLCSKYLSALVMVLLTVALLWSVALGGGAFYHGLGDLEENGYVIFSGGYVAAQFAVGTGFVLLGLATVAALGVMVSTFSSTMGGAIIVGLILYFFFDLLTLIPVSLGPTFTLGGETVHLPWNLLGFTKQTLVPFEVLAELPTGVPIRSWWTPAMLRMVATCLAFTSLFFAISAVAVRRRDFTL